MHSYYARVPAFAVQRQFDGHDYAFTRYGADSSGLIVGDRDRMMRVAFITNHEAYLLIARRGDAIPFVDVPADVTVHHVPGSFLALN